MGLIWKQASSTKYDSSRPVKNKYYFQQKMTAADLLKTNIIFNKKWQQQTCWKQALFLQQKMTAADLLKTSTEIILWKLLTVELTSYQNIKIDDVY